MCWCSHKEAASQAVKIAALPFLVGIVTIHSRQTCLSYCNGNERVVDGISFRAIPSKTQHYFTFHVPTQEGLGWGHVLQIPHNRTYWSLASHPPHDALSPLACVGGLKCLLDHEIERNVFSSPLPLARKRVPPHERGFPHFLLRKESTLNAKMHHKSHATSFLITTQTALWHVSRNCLRIFLFAVDHPWLTSPPSPPSFSNGRLTRSRGAMQMTPHSSVPSRSSP